MKKRIIQSLLAIVCCVTVALSAIPTAEAAMRASVVTGKVTLNGQVIDNKTAKYPLLIYSNITYFPMTYHLSRFMGVSADWNNGSKTLDITAGGARTAYAAETGKKQSGSVSVTLPSYMLVFLLAALESDEDKKLFTEIYEQYRPQMERTAMHFLKSHADVEDAVQNAFMQMIRHFEKIYEIPCEELSFWIISIVKNEALMIIRKSQKTVPLEDWDGLVRESENTSDYTELVDLFTKLPPSYRSVLEMKILHGFSDKEVAAHLGISETAVSSRASRGRSLLREIVKKEGFCI